jgi:hypothetical protein
MHTRSIPCALLQSSRMHPMHGSQPTRAPAPLQVRLTTATPADEAVSPSGGKRSGAVAHKGRSEQVWWRGGGARAGRWAGRAL